MGSVSSDGATQLCRVEGEGKFYGGWVSWAGSACRWLRMWGKKSTVTSISKGQISKYFLASSCDIPT